MVGETGGQSEYCVYVAGAEGIDGCALEVRMDTCEPREHPDVGGCLSQDLEGLSQSGEWVSTIELEDWVDVLPVAAANTEQARVCGGLGHCLPKKFGGVGFVESWANLASPKLVV